MRVTMMFVPSIPRTLVSYSLMVGLQEILTNDMSIGIKEVVTLTSDLSRKNLEKDFERMDTPQGTFYRMLLSLFSSHVPIVPNIAVA